MINIDNRLRHIEPSQTIDFGDLVRKSGGRLYLVVEDAKRERIRLLELETMQLDQDEYVLFSELQREVTLIEKSDRLELNWAVRPVPASEYKGGN